MKKLIILAVALFMVAAFMIPVMAMAATMRASPTDTMLAIASPEITFTVLSDQMNFTPGDAIAPTSMVTVTDAIRILTTPNAMAAQMISSLSIPADTVVSTMATATSGMNILIMPRAVVVSYQFQIGQISLDIIGSGENLLVNGVMIIPSSVGSVALSDEYYFAMMDQRSDAYNNNTNRFTAHMMQESITGAYVANIRPILML